MFLKLGFILFCFFFSLTTANQEQFFDDLHTQLNELNDGKYPELFSCGHSAFGVIFFCNIHNQLTDFNLMYLTVKSIPSSIADVQSLVTLLINDAELTSLLSDIDSLTNLKSLALNFNLLSSLPESMASMTQMQQLQLNFNCFTSFPHFLTSFSNLNNLGLGFNSLTTIPNEISNLTSLAILELSDNPSLQASTELFKEMKQMAYLKVGNTLISGLWPEGITADCNSSCISSSFCEINPSCPCSSFFADFCPKGCGVNSRKLCVDCSSLVAQQQCSGDCSWCSVKKDGFDCYWCDYGKNKCADSSRCSACFGYSSSDLCMSSSCHWCDYDYCVEKVDACEKACSNLVEAKCSSDLDCFWCSSYSVCLDLTSQCLTCDRFTSSFCPLGCDCPVESSNSTVLIVVCVVVCVVFLMICVCLFVLFALKKKSISSLNEMDFLSSSNTSLRFETDIGINVDSEHPIVSRYTKCRVDSLFRVSQSILSFSSSGSPLKLCSPATVSFELKNICGMELVVDCLFVNGFKEKHDFVFSPSSFTIGKNEKRKISVELTMKCSATLSPSQSMICCGISTNDKWCSLCGIQAQSELSTLLSCDDIELKRELGRGAFGKVFLGSFKGTEVAVKIYPSLTQENNEKEANMFSKLHSPHIVTFFGISQTLNAMIIEYCKYGSVEGLFARKEMTDWMKLLICYDCSLGMKYLHSNGIIHRDLKPDNLLIVSFSKDVNTVRAKISDFGTSRFLNQTMKMTETIGTPSYMAPEIFNNEPYGKKSDVYSFGLTVWSIFSKQIPFSELINVQTILLKVNEGYRPQLCQDCPLNDLIEHCWQTNSSDRPSFEEIVELLKQRIKTS